MTDTSLEREAIALFERLLDVPEPERDGWIERETVGRPILRDRLQAMREADRQSSLRTGGVSAVLADEASPATIGAYRIIERIGRGGMGSVYRAERMTGDFEHRVAIKVIKPGLFSEALVERFLRERQTLAALSHPNIAHLHDGGATESGSPFIVMELVDGLPLLRWVEEQAPSLAERRRIFDEICAAVGFAHRNLVVHRDLTPSNVLVTRTGSAKLIDFGIARPPEEDADLGVPASIASLSMTPGYAAPERMTQAGVAVSSDIYSLGKLLQKLMPDRSGDRELRAIIARATAAAPSERYPSAESLAEEVRAWGEGRPVEAVGGGKAYRVGKFVRRHRWAVGTASLALAMLLTALGVTLAANARAERARAAEAERFAQLRSLARYQLFDLTPQLERVIGNAAARTRLAARAQTYLTALAGSANADAGLRLEVAQGLIVLARNQGVPTEPNLGQPKLAEANLRRAVELLRAADLPMAAAAPALAESFALLAMIQAHVHNDTAAAEKSTAAAAQSLESVAREARNAGWYLARSQLVRSRLELALLGQDAPLLTTLATELEQGVSEWPTSLRGSRWGEIDRATASLYRGLSGYLTDRLEESIAAHRDADVRIRKLEAALPNDPVVLQLHAYNSYYFYGSASGTDAWQRDAQRFLADAGATVQRLLAIEPNDRTLKGFAASVRSAQAQGLADIGRYTEAIVVQREVVGLYRASLAQERRTATLNRLVLAELIRGNIARGGGDRAEACESYRLALDVVGELERAGTLLGFVKGRAPMLEANHRHCVAGDALTKLRDA